MSRLNKIISILTVVFIIVTLLNSITALSADYMHADVNDVDVDLQMGVIPQLLDYKLENKPKKIEVMTVGDCESKLHIYQELLHSNQITKDNKNIINTKNNQMNPTLMDQKSNVRPKGAAITSAAIMGFNKSKPNPNVTRFKSVDPAPHPLKSPPRMMANIIKAEID